MFYLLRAALCSTLLVFSNPVYSQQPQETPQVKPQQKTESTLKQEKNADKSVEKPNNVAPSSPIVVTLPAKEEEKRDTNKADEEGTEFWPSFFGYRLKITDTLLVLFTAGLFIATYFLWRATKNLVKGAEETAERQLRAYIFLDGAVCTATAPAPAFVMTFKNFGQTPAKKGSYWIDSAIDSPEATHFRKSSRRISGDFQLAPNSIIQIHELNTEPEQLTLFPEQVIAFNEGRIAFFIFGCFEYTDAFDKRRMTNFRVRYDCYTATKGVLANCHGGNDYK